MKGLQEILYSKQIDKKKLENEMKKIRMVFKNKEKIDSELINAISLNYQTIPIIIPHLSTNSIEMKHFKHFDQDFLALLLKNQINFPVEHILFDKKYKKIVLEEELAIELEKKEIELDKQKLKVIIREKSSVEKAIEKDDVDTLMNISKDTSFHFNLKIIKENQLFEYEQIPIILFSIEKHAMKCFKFLLINGANPLETITNFIPFAESYSSLENEKEKNIDGMTLGAEIGNLEIMQMIEERGGKIDENCVIGAVKFHQNHILKWIFEQKQEEKEINFGFIESLLNSSLKYSNSEGLSIFLEKTFEIQKQEETHVEEEK